MCIHNPGVVPVDQLSQGLHAPSLYLSSTRQSLLEAPNAKSLEPWRRNSK